MSALALLIMQVGPNPSIGAIPDVPDELANRPQRETAEVIETAPSPRSEYLSRCLALTTSEPEEALDFAQAWRVQVESDLELAQSAHCLGLGLVRLERYEEARTIFETDEWWRTLADKHGCDYPRIIDEIFSAPAFPPVSPVAPEMAKRASA